MSLITSCPACSTSFYISREQLSAHQGDVCCGKCKHVFNALERLGEVPKPADPATSPDQLIEISLPAAEIIPADSRISPSNAAMLAKEAESFFNQSAPEAKNQNTRARKLSLWLMSFMALFLLLLAAGQSLYYLRTPIASQWPVAKPYLIKACTILQCTVDLPKDIAQLVIDDSELQEDTEHQGLIHLSSTLINHAPFALEYPLFELSLTDADDKPILRRIFTASEYLPAGSDASAGIPAGEEVHIRLNFTTSGVTVAGYRVFLRYP